MTGGSADVGRRSRDEMGVLICSTKRLAEVAGVDQICSLYRGCDTRRVVDEVIVRVQVVSRKCPGKPERVFFKIVIFDQANFDVRCEWGENGVRELSGSSDAVIIVDVMSFSTCVTVATSLGATVYPYRFRDESRVDFADSINATLAGPRGKSNYSLSPASLMSIPKDTQLVLPSPSGSTLTLKTGETPTFAGCLRNCRTVANAAMFRGRKVAVIPAGERWREDGGLRPAVEDLIGAGSIIEHLKGSLSPEAVVAVTAYRNSVSNLLEILYQCSSGRELTDKGFAHDIPITAEVDVDDCAPILRDGAYVKE